MLEENSQSPSSTVIFRDGDLLTAHYRGSEATSNLIIFRTELENAIIESRRQGKHVQLLVDITELDQHKITAESRAEFMKITQLDFDNVAVFADKRMIKVIKAVIQNSNRRHKVQFFTNKAQANKWLRTEQHTQTEQLWASLISAILLFFITAVTLTGWFVGNTHLTRIISDLRPMNPLSAIGVSAIGLGFVAIFTRKLSLMKYTGIGLIAFGGLALSPLRTSVSAVLFTPGVHQAGSYGLITESGAFCFIAIGLCFIFYGQRRLLTYALTTLVALVALINFYGSLYFRDTLYNLSSTFVMSLLLSLAITISAFTILVLQFKKDKHNLIGQTSVVGWLVVVTFVALQFASYSIWSQSVSRNNSFSKTTFDSSAIVVRDNIAARIKSYFNVLNGFRGLYSSSASITQGEFNQYIQNLDLAKNYPGVRSIVYVAAVPTNQLRGYIAERRSDTSLYPKGNPDFDIRMLSSFDRHYILTYSSNTTLAPGLDFTSVASRRETYDKALSEKRSISSGTVKFNLNPNVPTQTGFFLTIPVANEKAIQNNIGFVTVAFNYTDFFAHNFDSDKLPAGLNIAITDKQDDSEVLSSTSSTERTVAPLQRQFDIPIANNNWNVKVDAPLDYALTNTQRDTPKNVLIASQACALLLIIIFALLNSSRSRAMRLADAITEDLRRERQVMLKLAQHDEAILNSIGEGLISFDNSGKIERVNSVLLKMFGYTEAEMVGQHFSSVFNAVDANGVVIPIEKRPLTKALKEGKNIFNTEAFWYVRKDGTSFPVKYTVAPIKLNGILIGLIEVIRDVTADMELDRQKDEFVSLTSHQLRTPLTAIRLFVEMLSDEQVGKLNVVQHDYINKVADSTRRMIALVGDFLNNSRIDLGRLRIEPEMTKLDKFVGDYVDELQPVAAERNIALTYSPNNLPHVPIDRNLYGQIVHNLLTNAIRYTPEGGNVSVAIKGSAKGYILSVADTGIGIPKAAQAKLFQRFFRAENAVLMQGEGSGLGLYLVKKILELTGGSITYETTVGKGTTFHAIIPHTGMKPAKGEVSLTNTRR